ncbi:hypothetical protein AVEN_109440-1 [Araneus ventricosus]|uniref:Uncharacterized protein n=1 Tax=Araneus ventricosus TaxID=182803 RepID=A0A4Y2MSX6_ARAVE|nr:hypothetical protein AVEN_109440-1 [Araneus ventricosus]
MFSYVSLFYDHKLGAHRVTTIRIARSSVTLWRTVLHHLTVTYISQYPPPDIGNSFCLVVRIFGSEPKGPRFYPAAKLVTRGQRTLHSPDGSTTTPTATQLSQFKACDTFHSTKPVTHFTARKVYDHFIAQSLHVPAHHQSGQQSAHMHAAHRFLDIQIISNKLGVAPSEERYRNPKVLSSILPPPKRSVHH